MHGAETALSDIDSGGGLTTGPLPVPIRTSFIAFVIPPVPIGIVAVVVTAQFARSDADLEVAATSVAVGVISAALLLVSWWWFSGLKCGTPEQLADSYRRRFFFRAAFANGAILAGFFAAILSASPIPYFVNLVCMLVGLATVAPTTAHLARDQEALTTQGCVHRLADSLQLSWDQVAK